MSGPCLEEAMPDEDMLLTVSFFRLWIGFRRSCAGICDGVPMAAASGAPPLVDNSCWQIGRANRSCDHVSAGTGISPL
jgi:hypothetical protein